MEVLLLEFLVVHSSYSLSRILIDIGNVLKNVSRVVIDDDVIHCGSLLVLLGFIETDFLLSVVWTSVVGSGFQDVE